VDPEGLALITAANGLGGLRTKLHNTIQNAILDEAACAGMRAFPGQVIDAEAALRLSNWQGPGVIAPEDEANAPQRSQIRPDIILDFESTQEIPFPDNEKPPNGTSMLFDVKTLGFLTTVYTARTLQEADREVHNQEPAAVASRARKVHGEYLGKARQRDGRFVHSEDEEGPFVGALKSYGVVQGLAVGVFGEMSRQVDVLVNHFARVSARRAVASSGLRMSVNQHAAVFRSRIVRRLGSAAGRGVSQVMLRIVSETASSAIDAGRSRGRRYYEHDVQVALERQFPRFHGGFAGPGPGEDAG